MHLQLTIVTQNGIGQVGNSSFLRESLILTNESTHLY